MTSPERGRSIWRHFFDRTVSAFCPPWPVTFRLEDLTHLPHLAGCCCFPFPTRQPHYSMTDASLDLLLIAVVVLFDITFSSIVWNKGGRTSDGNGRRPATRSGTTPLTAPSGPPGDVTGSRSDRAGRRRER